MKSILVLEDMSGAHESLKGFKDCEKLALVVLYNESGNTVYHREFVSERTKLLALEVANQLVEDCMEDKYENEVILAFYTFEGLDVDSDMKEQLYHKNPFSAAYRFNDRMHNVSCFLARWATWGDKFDMHSFETIQHMVTRDFYMRDKVKEDIIIKANGIDVGKAIYHDGFHYMKFYQYPFDTTTEKVFIRFVQQVNNDRAVFEIEANGEIFYGSFEEMIENRQIVYELNRKKSEYKPIKEWTDEEWDELLKDKKRDTSSEPVPLYEDENKKYLKSYGKMF